jgi:diadenosine tetraphosphate (Ap4A) HIT family hydrolase
VADAADDDCLICSMEAADPAARVFLDELWAAEVAPGFEVPGWFFLRARRHAEKLTGLDEEETAVFGRRAHDLVSAVERVTGAPAVYLLSFGENFRHFHALVAARGDQVPPEARGWALLQLLAGGRDVPAAQAVAGDVRLAYEEIVRGREHAAVG